MIFGGRNSGVEWQQVCLNSPHLDQVPRENAEILTGYGADGYGVYQQVIAALIRKLLPVPALKVRNLPSTAQVTVMEQTGGSHRFVIHLLHYPFTRRAPNLDIIEEPGLLKDVELQLRTASHPRRVRLAPAGADVPVRYANGYATLTVPFVEGHQATVIEI